MLLNCGVSLSKDNPYCLNFCLVDKMPLVARILKNKLLFLQVTTVEFSVRTPSFGRSGAATVYFVDQCLALTVLCYFFVVYEKKYRPFATEIKNLLAQ